MTLRELIMLEIAENPLITGTELAFKHKKKQQNIYREFTKLLKAGLIEKKGFKVTAKGKNFITKIKK